MENNKVMQDYWESLIASARNGDVDDAREVLQDFCEAVENVTTLKQSRQVWTGPIPLEVAIYLAESFRAILKGSNPEKALNLVGKTKGRRKGKTITHDLDAIAAAHALLMRSGLRSEQAKSELSKDLGVDRSTVDRARKGCEAYKHQDVINDEILKVAAKPYAKRIGAILQRCRANTTKSRSRK